MYANDTFLKTIESTYAETITEEVKELTRYRREDITSYEITIESAYHISEIGEHAEYIGNFIYDRVSGMFFCDVNTGYHGALAEYIMISKGLVNDGFDSWSDYEDDFITKGHGMVLSSIKNHIFVGQDVQLTAQEKIVFHKMGLDICRI